MSRRRRTVQRPDDADVARFAPDGGTRPDRSPALWPGDTYGNEPDGAEPVDPLDATFTAQELRDATRRPGATTTRKTARGRRPRRGSVQPSPVARAATAAGPVAPAGARRRHPLSPMRPSTAIGSYVTGVWQGLLVTAAVIGLVEVTGKDPSETPVPFFMFLTLLVGPVWTLALLAGWAIRRPRRPASPERRLAAWFAALLCVFGIVVLWWALARGENVF